jgi:hypothetical protein
LVSVAEVDIQPIQVQRWGSLQKSIRVFGWILRFLRNARSPASNRNTSDLTFEELEIAKTQLIRTVQRQFYRDEIARLEGGLPIQKSSSIYKLSPYIDSEGLLRVQGRLEFADLTYDEKHPVIIPKSWLAQLIVEFQHTLLKHAGVNALITSIRNTYWIVGLRRIAKAVKSRCIACQRLDSRACVQPMAPLPDLRVQRAYPFAVMGIDHAGPLFCLDVPGHKFYILLITCATVRAVHLELVSSLNVQECVRGIRRFVARRGLPTVIYSDNAKTFVTSRDVLRNLYGELAPDWRFSAPRSPWWGGFWERLVRSVKSALKKSIGVRALTFSELETTLIEVEACINSRPLTFVGDSVSDRSPLTPSHFLIGRSGFYETEFMTIVPN